jgi:hypothetical protein
MIPHRSSFVGVLVLSTFWWQKGVLSFDMAILSMRGRKIHGLGPYRDMLLIGQPVPCRPTGSTHHQSPANTACGASLLTDDDFPASPLEQNIDTSSSSNLAAFPIKDSDGIYDIQSKEQHL